MKPLAGEELAIVSSVVVTVQAAGALLLGATLLYLSRLFGAAHAARWAVSWGALALALGSVRAYIAFGGRGWWALYLVAEWAFLLLLAAGCVEFTGSGHFRPFRLAPALLPASAVAFFIVQFPASFDGLFAGQTVVLAGMCAFAFRCLGRAEPQARTSGWQIMRIALAILTALFSSYMLLFSVDTSGPLGPLLGYSSVADLLGEMLLGIGMVLVLSEEARHHLQRALHDLETAHAEIEVLARVDPLTEAFNRHAFNSLLRGEPSQHPAAGGTAVMVDLDYLKRINDAEGHAAGDAALRAVARAIRSLIRPEDLLFRWGGDEFLVLLPNVDEAAAAQRLAALDEGIRVDLGSGVSSLSLSWGVARFDAAVPMSEAISRADEAMYRRRAASRRDNPAASRV